MILSGFARLGNLAQYQSGLFASFAGGICAFSWRFEFCTCFIKLVCFRVSLHQMEGVSAQPWKRIFLSEVTISCFWSCKRSLLVRW